MLLLMDSSLMGFAAAFVFACLIILVLQLSNLPVRVKQLLILAVCLRVIGSQLYPLIFAGGDYNLYFNSGASYAQRLWSGDASMFFHTEEWRGGRWWGTQFPIFLSGLAVALIGPSKPGVFLVFAMLGLLGLVGCAMAFHRMYPQVPPHRYLVLVLLFPSLWFWPAAIGKDAILLMGLGLALWGYVGRNGRIHWLLLASGLYFIFAIRPQVAAVFVFAIVAGHWLSLGGEWTMRRTVQSALLLLAGLWVIQLSMRSIGVDGFDAHGVQGYFDHQASIAERTSGTAVKMGGGGWSGAAVGLFNILLRPFPWEAHSATTMIAAAEIWGFWLLAWFHRSRIRVALRAWRSDRLVAVTLPFVVFYSAALGMTVANMGIIVRQRIFIFPFLFFLFAAPAIARRTHSPRLHPASTGRIQLTSEQFGSFR